jgi:hypothetical protein
MTLPTTTLICLRMVRRFSCARQRVAGNGLEIVGQKRLLPHTPPQHATREFGPSGVASEEPERALGDGFAGEKM